MIDFFHQTEMLSYRNTDKMVKIIMKKRDRKSVKEKCLTPWRMIFFYSQSQEKLECI